MIPTLYPLLIVLIATLLGTGQGIAATSDINRYVLGDGDRINILVYGEEDLSMEIRLSANGQFDYPYLGRIRASGKTAGQLKEIIERGLKGDYLIKPKVSVNITQFRQFYVNGEVKHPGGYEYQPGLTVDKAIALAGGFTDRASRNKIKMTNEKTGREEKTVPLSRSVRPGDIIVVEQSFF